jgi:hypothetical protein
MKNAVFWNVMLCASCKNRPFGGTYRLHHQGDKNGFFPISPILLILTTEVLRSYETSVLTRATLRNTPEDGILHKLISGVYIFDVHD